MTRRSLASVLLGAAACAGSAHADINLTDLEANAAAAQQTAVSQGWQGSVALGYLQTTGNSNTIIAISLVYSFVPAPAPPPPAPWAPPSCRPGRMQHSVTRDVNRGL